MEQEIKYKTLYALQDIILALVNRSENDFYLTGGTALHRFYYGARYSDDLDFFVNNANTFKEDIDEILREFESHSLEYDIKVQSRDFYRIMIDNTLQLDFVNDRVYRYKKSLIIDHVRVDNKINILTNKLGAIIDRDEEKDIFDLFCLAYHEKFDWKEILSIANKKAVVEKDTLIYRLNSFPLQWLERVKKIKHVDITKDAIEKVSSDIINQTMNSLYKES